MVSNCFGFWLVHTKYISGGSRNWEGGGGGGRAPARVWQSSRRGRPGEGAEGDTPPAQQGGVGERCKLLHRGLGLCPRSQRFLRRKPPQKYAKNVITDRGWGATDQELSLYMFNAPMHRR